MHVAFTVIHIAGDVEEIDLVVGPYRDRRIAAVSLRLAVRNNALSPCHSAIRADCQPRIAGAISHWHIRSAVRTGVHVAMDARALSIAPSASIPPQPSS